MALAAAERARGVGAQVDVKRVAKVLPPEIAEPEAFSVDFHLGAIYFGLPYTFGGQFDHEVEKGILALRSDDRRARGLAPTLCG
jgi:hypothetical protein